jgi:hypothetical protein
MDRDPFEWWYPLTTIAKRVNKSPLTIRRAMLSGKFGGRPGEPNFPGRFVCGQWCFPWSAVARFLGIDASAAGPSTVTWRARSEGELRRKAAVLSVVQTSEREAIHG